MTDFALAQIMERKLNRVTTASKAQRIADEAQAMAEWASENPYMFEFQSRFVDIKVKAERKCRELLREKTA